ncbi:class I SAM-dependent methyltransferase [Brevibacillus dissolubilis]|uniref:class I SAM-dependent methyltransferase n=1 Tax=Brevibacillus dissolubilis TaxID=1844116 RepID=UPI00159BB3E5|nr:class I SAM-dependent methyltransferase [Brevibacillus dissolubilis]
MQDYVSRNKETFDRLGTEATDVNELIRIASQALPGFQMLLAGGSVLDLGCGVGHDSLRLKRHRLHVAGLDISEVMLEAAKEQVEGVSFIQGDFRNLPFDNSSYDGVWANGSLFYVTPEDLRRTLAEVARILRPGGVFFASYIAGEGEFHADSLYHRRYTWEELEPMYREAGFRTIDNAFGQPYFSIMAVK